MTRAKLTLPPPQPSPEWDRQVADLIRWLRTKGFQAHTRRGQALLIRPRQARKSRLTGGPR